MTINDPGGGGCEVQGKVTFQKHEVYSRGDFAENDRRWRFPFCHGDRVFHYKLSIYFGDPPL